MFRYFVDQERKYYDVLLQHLRAHNGPNIPNKDSDSTYVYVYEDKELIGYVEGSYGWSWVSFNHIYYRDTRILRTLVYEVIQKYQKRALGFMIETSAKEQIKDLLDVGFYIDGTIPGTTNTNDVLYLQIDAPYQHVHQYDVHTCSEKLEQHEKCIADFVQDFEIRNRIEKDPTLMLYIATQGDEFVGGVHFKVYKESIHVHLLAVVKKFRGNQIGTELMNYVETYARKHHIEMIDLGTTEFQARPFYEKMGYKVMHTRKNYPEGYECYTLIKNLKE